MKFLIFFCFLFIKSQNVFAFSAIKRAVVRDENFNAKICDVSLLNLENEDNYDGKYFKIVLGKNNEAVSFHDSEDIQLKAATTYFHLNKARDYFVNTVKSEYVNNLPKLIIRIEHTNVFNEIGHFANDNLNPQYNNALSIPAGKGYAIKNIAPWNNEIWFRPSKEISLNEMKDSVDIPSTKQAVVAFRNQTHMTNFDQFLTALLLGRIALDGSGINSVMMLFQNSIFTELIYQSSDVAAEFFARKIYRLDSALVPEIIYHEFSHIALSDHLELSHSTPVNEGLADFFAGKIANSKKLATHINKYNLFNGKEVHRKQQYRQAFERGEYANTDFVFGLLWNVGSIVGTDKEAQYMYAVAKKINTNSSIRDGLIKSTLDTCLELCTNPLSDQLKLYKLYYSKNI